MTFAELSNMIIAPRNRIKALLSFLAPALVIIIRPINLTGNQAVVLGGLLLVIIWLATSWVKREIACIVLLLCFLIFGNVSPVYILNFPLSEGMLMIVAAFLLSAGVVKSKVTEQFSDFCIRRFCRKGIHLIIISFVLAILLIFIIPHPFPRVLLMAAIYVNFLDKSRIETDKRPVFFLIIFTSVQVTSLLFINGDVIAIYAAFTFAGISLSYADYAKYMFLPTLGASLLVFLSYSLTFRRELSISFPKEENPTKPSLSREGFKTLSVMIIVIILWALESLHGINTAIIAAVGAVLMFLLKIIGLKEIKNLNYGLLLFLTSMSAIGRTLIGSGTAEKIRDAISPFLPASDSFWFLPVIVIIIMSLHMLVGSVTAGLSVSIPIVIILTEGVWPPEFVAVLAISILTFHYVLPFHNAVIMIGFANGYYENRHVLRFSPLLTLAVLASVFLFYVPWWNYLGVM